VQLDNRAGLTSIRSVEQNSVQRADALPEAAGQSRSGRATGMTPVLSVHLDAMRCLATLVVFTSHVSG